MVKMIEGTTHAERLYVLNTILASEEESEFIFFDIITIKIKPQVYLGKEAICIIFNSLALSGFVESIELD